MIALSTRVLVIALLLYSSYSCAGWEGDYYFVDAHSQIDHKVEGVGVVIKRMSTNKVKTTLLSARGKRSWRDILVWSKEYPNEIMPLLRSKSQPYRINSPEYYQKIRQQIDTGGFVGAAEILVFHAQKGNKAPEVAVDLTDDRVSVLIDESLKQSWPVVIHIEFAALLLRERQRYMDGLTTLLEKYPRHPFVLIHMAQLDYPHVQELIERHSNLYFFTSHTDPVSVNSSKQPWVNIFTQSGYHFKEPWKNLFTTYPERFVFALDNVWDHHWQDSYGEKIEYWKNALSELPESTAHLIAHGNAERLWRIK